MIISKLYTNVKKSITNTYDKCLESIGIIVLFIILFGAAVYITNIVKFSNCDFKSDYKCEVIHGIGLFPAFTIFAVWFDSDA